MALRASLALLALMGLLAAGIAAAGALAGRDHTALVAEGDVVVFEWEAIDERGATLATSRHANGTTARAIVSLAAEHEGRVELSPYFVGRRVGATVATPVFAAPFGKVETVWVPGGSGPFPIEMTLDASVLENATALPDGTLLLANGSVAADPVGDEPGRVRLRVADGDVLHLPRLGFPVRVELLNATHFQVHHLLEAGDALRAGACLLDLAFPQGALAILARESNGTFRAHAAPLDVPAPLVGTDARFVFRLVEVERATRLPQLMGGWTARAAPGPALSAAVGGADFGTALRGCCDWCVSLAEKCPFGVSTFRCGEFPSCDCYFLCAVQGVTPAALLIR